MKPIVGQTQRVYCTVNAVNAGRGDLEIMVNGGSVPCTVQSRGNRILHASFIPRTAIPHDVEVRFNGQEVEGMLFNSQLISRLTQFTQPSFSTHGQTMQ